VAPRFRNCSNPLGEVGLQTIADLERIGPVAAFRQLNARRSQTGLNVLWSLAAGLHDLDGQSLPEATKQRLLRELIQTENPGYGATVPVRTC